jgi:molybdopterin synthase catalytic subunit
MEYWIIAGLEASRTELHHERPPGLLPGDDGELIGVSVSSSGDAFRAFDEAADRFRQHLPILKPPSAPTEGE